MRNAQNGMRGVLLKQQQRQPEPRYLLVFLNFKSAGGDELVHSKLSHALKKYVPNRKAAPWNDTKTEVIPFWIFDRSHFTQFVRKVRRKGVEYVSHEWNGLMHWDTLNFCDTRLVTCLRDPYSRFKADYAEHSAAGESMRAYAATQRWWSESNMQRFRVNHNQHNYYVKMLLGQADVPEEELVELTEEHLEIAKKRLDMYDTIVIYDIPETHKLLRKYVSEEFSMPSQLKTEPKSVVKAVVSECLSEQEFQSLNKLDYALYQHAVALAKRQLAVQ